MTDKPKIDDGGLPTTLRDYFAGMAMQGILAGWDKPNCEFDPRAVASRAFTAADFMIARKRETEGGK